MFYTIFVVQIQILIQICRKPYETETKDDAKPAPKRKLPSPQVDCLHEPEAGTNIFWFYETFFEFVVEVENCWIIFWCR